MRSTTAPAAELWHETAAAKRILASLTADDIATHWAMPVMGEGFIELVGPEALAAIRERHVDTLFGCTFLEAERRGRGEEYLALYGGQPSVHAVLCERFGDPVRFIGFGRDTARRLWREAAAERVAERQAA